MNIYTLNKQTGSYNHKDVKVRACLLVQDLFIANRINGHRETALIYQRNKVYCMSAGSS